MPNLVERHEHNTNAILNVTVVQTWLKQCTLAIRNLKRLPVTLATTTMPAVSALTMAGVATTPLADPVIVAALSVKKNHKNDLALKASSNKWCTHVYNAAG